MDNTQTTKTLKDFEEKLNINPEFFGLFRDELIRMETPNLENIVNKKGSIKTKESTKSKGSTKDSTKGKSKKDKKKSIKIKENAEEKVKTINIINENTINDDLNTKIEIENKKEQEKKICSSTLVSVDELKSLNLSKYEIFKLEEIIKFFNLFENEK